MRNIRVLLLGIFFGIVLVKGQVISWFRINQMFRFADPYMYLVIGSAIVVGIVSVLIIRRFNAHTIDGEPILISAKSMNKGTVLGGIIFGLGWAITGACPGPIYAQIGSGTYLAIITFIAAISGAYIYAILRQRLPV